MANTLITNQENTIGPFHVGHRLIYWENLNKRSVVDEDWIREVFPQVVKLSNADAKVGKVPTVRELPKRILPVFPRQQFARELIAPQTDGTLEEKILSILLNSHIRRGSLSTVARYSSHFLSLIQQKIRQNKPIELVLPTLPFKNQNPLTTGHSLGWTDLGEYLSLLQLKTITDSIQQLYSPGARITVLTDGMVYVDMFGNKDTKGVDQYFQQLWHIKERLGLGNAVELVDMSWLVKAQPEFEEVKRQMQIHLEEIEKKDELVAECMSGLRYGMLFAFPVEYTLEEYAKCLFTPETLLPQAITRKAERLANEYASFLLTMKKLNIVKHAFPDAIRATVHCKDAPQLPLHLVNKHSWIFPYHGVPLVDKAKLARSSSLHKSTRIIRLSDVYDYPNVTAVFLQGEKEPFYYEV